MVKKKEKCAWKNLTKDTGENGWSGTDSWACTTPGKLGTKLSPKRKKGPANPQCVEGPRLRRLQATMNFRGTTDTKPFNFCIFILKFFVRW